MCRLLCFGFISFNSHKSTRCVFEFRFRDGLARPLQKYWQELSKRQEKSKIGWGYELRLGRVNNDVLERADGVAWAFASHCCCGGFLLPKLGEAREATPLPLLHRCY